MGIAVDRTPDAPQALAGAFDEAVLLTIAAGLAVIGTALLVDRYAGRGTEIGRDLREPRRAATVFVAAGFVGASAAVARFLVAGTANGDLWSSTRSFWQGNSYLLLAATAAIPGLGLLLLDTVRRGSRVRTAAIAAVMAAYVLLLAPSGQRGFALQIGLVIVAVLAIARRLRLRTLAPAAVVVLALLGLTQAARNEARETGSITVAGVVARLEPGRLETLYGSQLSSFQWTWDVVAFGDQLDIPNTFLHAVAKPIPRQLMPDKVQGFGEEFTKRLYPDAFEQQVAFSVPLVAETYYAFGWLGVLLLFVSVGAAVALLDSTSSGLRRRRCERSSRSASAGQRSFSSRRSRERRSSSRARGSSRWPLSARTSGTCRADADVSSWTHFRFLPSSRA